MTTSGTGAPKPPTTAAARAGSRRAGPSAPPAEPARGPTRQTGRVGDAILRGGTVLLDGAWRPTDLAVLDGRIAGSAPAEVETVELDGFLVAPGYVDLQCNGGLGIDLASDPERLWELGALLPRFGVTAWLPTIVTTPDGVVDRALDTLGKGPPAGWRGATPLGLHLEGPFLSPAKRGAHPDALLRAPSLAAIERWSREAGVAIVTIAPDLPGALEVIDALVERGVVVSLGHTPASVEQATAGVDAGARWITHLFNAMAPLHHREPGLAGVALRDERVHVGLIPDGIHVHPHVVATAQRALGDRLTIVTDAVGALGMPAGRQALGRTEVTIDDSGVRLADGTLAGSNLSMDQGVRNLVAFTGCSTATAIHAAATAPAAVLDDRSRGHLGTGACADAVVLTTDLHLVSTIVSGEVVHDARWSR
jgi:N-acetylglucosamine-6-phosphate deacetylase